MSTRSPLIEFIISYPKVLLNVDFLKEIFMIPERIFASNKDKNNSIFEISCPGYFYIGKLFIYEGDFYSVETFERIYKGSSDEKIYTVLGRSLGLKYNENESNPLSTPQDVFTLYPSEIENFKGTEAIETTIGRFIANYLFLVYPFQDKIDYKNEEFTTSKLEKSIAPNLMSGRITPADVKGKYGPTLSLIGQSNDIICPNISEKTITIPPHIHALREKLVKDNLKALQDGDVSVMTEIEEQLIRAYREYLQGDSSLHFLLKKKYFNVTLKKLFLTQGIVERFGSPGQFDFVSNPMGNGWKIKDLPVIFNEVRHGSYSRAIETQNGGVVAKLILRVFQDTRITIDDCKTKRGELVFASKENIKEFDQSYMIDENNKTVLITSSIADSISGKMITVRTPGYCESSVGFCAKCFGHVFEVIGQKAFAPVANDLGGQITRAALKRMHGSSHETVDISDLNRYLVM